jgi:hypothetical protein
MAGRVEGTSRELGSDRAERATADAADRLNLTG